MAAIKVEKLTKKFGDLTAVDHISFSVKSGEFFGILGPNGAGKTTIINMLSTLIKPTSGYGEVAGYDVSKNEDEVRMNIGIVFQEPALDTMLTGKENLEFHAMIYNLSKEEREKRVEEVLKLVELTNKANILVENYSGGMKRRLEIARGLIHKPKVLFLDEPTLGLDTQTRRHIWDYIKKLNKENKTTIILTTHYMEEADYLCDRTAIIDYGKIVALNIPNKLKDMLGGDIISLETKGNIKNFIAHLKNLKYIKAVKKHDSTLSLTVKQGEKKIPELIKLAQKTRVGISSVSLHKPSLEDVFLHFTGKTIREREASNHEKSAVHFKRKMMFHR